MRTLRSLQGSAAIAALLAVAAPAYAQEQTYRFNIPAQNLGGALRAYGQQSNQQIVFSEAAVRGKQSGRLVGAYTARQGLELLLKDSALSWSRTPAGVLYVGNGAAAPAEAPSAPAAPVETSSTVGELVVTAQKREERLKDVPISISVLTGESLDRSAAQGTTEALSRVPGVAVNVTYQGGGTQLVVRGVTAGGALFNGASPVSYYLDSVPFGLVRQAIVPDANAYDLERVEVLRGPQGTLYGASAQNGVVRVLTHDARLDRYEGKARASIATTKGGDLSFRGDVAVNVPLIQDKLAARIVLGYQDLGGWIDRPAEKNENDAEIQNARLKINAQPTEGLSIGASAWISRADYGAPSIGNDRNEHFSLNDNPVETDFEAYSLRVAYDLPAVNIVSSTSHLQFSNKVLEEFAELVAGVHPTEFEAEVFTQEVVLNSNLEGPWRWTVGGIYRDAKDKQYQVVDGVVGALDQRYKSESYAAYGSVTRLFLDGTFELTGGLRYFEDRVKSSERSRLGDPTAQLFSAAAKFTALSPRVVLTWHPDPDSTVYASYSEGFRSGFPQSGSLLSVSNSFPPLEADNLVNYEVGAKGELLGGRIDYDAALYFVDWKDVQQSLTVPLPNSTALATALVNAGSASGVGLDIGVSFQATDDLSLGVNGSWNDLRFDHDVISSRVVLFDKGDRLNVSPEYMVSAFLDYRTALSGDLEGRLSASVNWTSEMDLRTIAGGQRSLADGDAMFIVRASYAVESASGWSASVFAENLTNEQGSPVGFPFVPGIVTDHDARIRPRTIGVQVEYRF